MRSAAQRWCRPARSKKATSGPVSMIANITAEAREMVGIRTEVRSFGRDHPACASHQSGQAERATLFARCFQGKPQPLFNQLLEFATAQCSLRFCPTVKIIRQLTVVFISPLQEAVTHKPVKHYNFVYGTDLASCKTTNETGAADLVEAAVASSLAPHAGRGLGGEGFLTGVSTWLVIMRGLPLTQNPRAGGQIPTSLQAGRCDWPRDRFFSSL